MKSHKYFAFGSLICMIMAMLYDVFLYQKVRGGAMQDVLSERHLKISTFRRRKPGVQPFGQLPYSQTLQDKWLPSFSRKSFSHFVNVLYPMPRFSAHPRTPRSL